MNTTPPAPGDKPAADQVEDIESRAALQQATLALLGRARRSVDIYTRDIEADLYGTPAVLEALSSRVLQHKQLLVRLLVRDPRQISSRGQRLLELGRRLSSNIQFRTPTLSHRDFAGAYMVIDQQAYVYRPLAARHEGKLSYNHPAQAGQYARSFNEAWEHAVPDTEFLRLHI